MTPPNWQVVGLAARDLIKATYSYYGEKVYFYASQFDYLMEEGKGGDFAIISFSGGDVLERTGSNEFLYNYEIRSYVSKWSSEAPFEPVDGDESLGSMSTDLYNLFNQLTTIDVDGVCSCTVTGFLPNDSTTRLGANAEHYNASSGISIQYRVDGG